MSNSATKHKILWVDDDPLILSVAERLLRRSLYELKVTPSPEQAKSLLKIDTFAVLICDQRMPGMTGIELLSFARQHSPHTSRIMITAFLDEGLIEEAINRAAIFRFITKPWNDPELLLDLQTAVDHHTLTLTQHNLLREVKDQNRRLEEFTEGLEEIVNERTRSIELSKLEVERKSSRIRDLVRFVTELSSVTGIEDMLHMLRKELRRFHQVSSPILAYFGSDLKAAVLTYRASQIIYKEPLSVWSNSLRIRVNELADQKYLANQFGRPFQRVIAVPLRRRWYTEEGEQDLPPTIFLEHSFNESEIEPFLEFLSERLQPVSLALDRLLLESQMRFSSLQWESTFDGIQDPVAIVDVDFRVTRANRSFGSPVANQPCFKIFADRDTMCPGCPIQSVVESKRPQVSQIKRGDRFYSVYSYPIKLNEGVLSTNLINHYLDITESRALYGHMIQNEKMAAIGLMAGNIAHELNNPLTGIRSLSQILLQEIPDGPVHNDLLEVEKAAARSESIIRNLLDFSRGSSTPQLVDVSLNEIVTKTLPMLKTAMRSHNTEINLTEDNLVIRAEPQLLQQVVFNLVNNACQAMQSPGVLVVQTQRVSPTRAQLLVRDTGTGIPEELMERIFDPFFTTKIEGQGTGLGLSMSRSIVEQFGGTIEVRSTPGHGAEFRIDLPLAEKN